MGPTFIGCGGAHVDFTKALDRDQIRKADVQYPFDLSSVKRKKFNAQARLQCFGTDGYVEDSLFVFFRNFG